MFAALASKLGRIFRNGEASSARSFRSREAFAMLLEVERHRADRTNDAFSLLTFTPSDDQLESETFERLDQILQTRLRITDQVGWLDREHVGVLLPSTSAAGAWTVADDVCLRFPSDIPPPKCTVLTYPSESANSNGEERQVARSARGGSRPVQAMETLFMVKTPRWKRAIDIVGASAGLIVLSPVLVATAAAVKVSSPGPILFSQLRSGQGGKQFRMYKFRSMVVDAESQRESLLALNEQDGPAFKVKNDPRVTRLGRFLRSSSLDELPQLWNVLCGDMSIVGPRPLPCFESDGCNRWQRRRLDVPPGLTCIWQVQGRSQVSFDEWARMDMQYIRTRAMWNDVKLILRTVPAVLLRNGH